MPVGKLPLALNAFLPPDIRVMAARRCAADFHARFDATGKQYRYQVWNHPTMNPLLRQQAWHVPQRLDLERMGRPIGERDLLIASIALARRLTVITHNVSEFRRVPGLRIEDWV